MCHMSKTQLFTIVFHYRNYSNNHSYSWGSWALAHYVSYEPVRRIPHNPLAIIVLHYRNYSNNYSYSARIGLTSESYASHIPIVLVLGESLCLFLCEGGRNFHGEVFKIIRRKFCHCSYNRVVLVHEVKGLADCWWGTLNL
jgi:hypothetical protein